MFSTSKIKKVLFPSQYKKEKAKVAKKVFVFSALTGVVSSAITMFFSKKENVDALRENAKMVGSKVKSVANTASTNASNMANKIKENIDQLAIATEEKKEQMVNKINEAKDNLADKVIETANSSKTKVQDLPTRIEQK
jgi:flagellar basal body-associated protein FliL